MTMTIETTGPSKINVPKEWISLEENFRLRLIQTDKQYEAALKVMLELGKKESMTELESDFFDVLSVLVGQYEDEKYPIDTSGVSVIDILKSFMEDHNLTGTDLGQLIGGDKTVVSKILNGKRKLTLSQIKALSEHFKVSSDLFIE